MSELISDTPSRPRLVVNHCGENCFADNVLGWRARDTSPKTPGPKSARNGYSWARPAAGVKAHAGVNCSGPPAHRGSTASPPLPRCASITPRPFAAFGAGPRWGRVLSMR